MIIPDINTAKSLISIGKIKQALEILRELTKLNPQDEEAWWYRSLYETDERESLECLKQILLINSNSTRSINIRNYIQNNLVLNSLPEPNPEQEKKPETTISKKTDAESETKIKRKSKIYKSTINKEPKASIDQEISIPQIQEDKKRGRSQSKKDETSDKKPNPVHRMKFADDFFGDLLEGHIQAERNETGIYGNRIIVDGVRISLYDLPPCLNTDDPIEAEPCMLCEYFSPQNCVLRFDQYIAEELKLFATMRLERLAEIEHRSSQLRMIIYKELKMHGKPLHYSFIQKIIMGRYPNLHLNENKIYSILLKYQDLFERVGEGVYRAK